MGQKTKKGLAKNGKVWRVVGMVSAPICLNKLSLKNSWPEHLPMTIKLHLWVYLSSRNSVVIFKIRIILSMGVCTSISLKAEINDTMHSSWWVILLNVKSSGNINEDYLRELLTTMGDRFTDDQVDDMFREAPIDSATSDFNYIEVLICI